VNPKEMPRDEYGRWTYSHDEEYEELEEKYYDELEEEYYTSTASHAWAKEGYTYPMPNPIPRSLAEDKETVIQALSFLYSYSDEVERDPVLHQLVNQKIEMLEKGLTYIEKASVATYAEQSYTNLVNIARKELGQPPL
jgi:hypothetical protein